MNEHGTFKLWAGSNILYAKISGAWNEATAQRFSKEFQVLVRHKMPSQWAHVVFLDNWELGVPAIEPIIQNLVDWCIQHGLQRSAQVFSQSMMKKYQLDKMVTEQKGHFMSKQFRTLEAARDWLKESDFVIVPDELHPAQN